MNRRSFLRFLGVAPAISKIDMVDLLAKIPRLLSDKERMEMMRRKMLEQYVIDMEKAIIFGRRCRAMDKLLQLPYNSRSPQILDGT